MKTWIANSYLAFKHMAPVMTADVEELWAMALDSTQEVLALDLIFRGTVNECLAHPRDIFRFGCRANATSLIVAHNHPSGDLLPSYRDIRFTKKLVRLGAMMQIPVSDHLILGKGAYYSMADMGVAGFKGKR